MKYAVNCERREVFFTPITEEGQFRNRLELLVNSRFRIVEGQPVLNDVEGELSLVKEDVTIPMHKKVAKDMTTLMQYMVTYCEERVYGLK